jgi:hypothetical protein
MSIDRRSFLTRLVGGAVGLSLVNVEWVPTPIVRHVTGDLSTIEGATSEFLRRMVEAAPDTRAVFVPGVRGIGAEGMTNQWNVVFDDLLNVRQHIQPHVASLMKRVAGYRAFGALPVDIHGVDATVAMDERTGLAVRGVRQYDVYSDELLYRFDVLGRAT